MINLNDLTVWMQWSDQSYFLQAVGIGLVRNAITAPCRTIAQNAGVDASVIVSKVMEAEGDMGYDAATGQFVNMVESGIIDPTKVSLPLAFYLIFHNCSYYLNYHNLYLIIIITYLIIIITYLIIIITYLIIILLVKWGNSSG